MTPFCGVKNALNLTHMAFLSHPSYFDPCLQFTRFISIFWPIEKNGMLKFLRIYFSRVMGSEESFLNRSISMRSPLCPKISIDFRLVLSTNVQNARRNMDQGYSHVSTHK